MNFNKMLSHKSPRTKIISSESLSEGQTDPAQVVSIRRVLALTDSFVDDSNDTLLLGHA